MNDAGSFRVEVVAVERVEAETVCVDCRHVIEPGEAKVTVPNSGNPKAPWWRCGDCQYRSEHE